MATLGCLEAYLTFNLESDSPTLSLYVYQQIEEGVESLSEVPYVVLLTVIINLKSRFSNKKCLVFLLQSYCRWPNRSHPLHCAPCG